MMVQQRKGASGGIKFEGFKQVGTGDQQIGGDGHERELTSYEIECLQRFQKNDEEID